MVRFFNQKEEVLSIELTPYGRQRFASGSFAPAFYAFYDNSIMYDGNYGGVTETQNQITNRISNQTPRVQPVTRFTSSAGSVFSLVTAQTQDDFSQDNLWNAPFYRMLGNSDPNSIYAPSWKMNVLYLSDTELNGGVQYNSDNMIQRSLSFINDKSTKGESLSSQIDPYVLASTINGLEQDINNNFPTLNDTYVEFFLDISADEEIAGIVLPTNSTLYRKNVDRDPIDICDITEASGFDLNGEGDG